MWVSNKSQVTSLSSQPWRALPLWCVRTSHWRPVKQHWEEHWGSRPHQYLFPKLRILISFIRMAETVWHNGSNGRGEGRGKRLWMESEKREEKCNIELDKSSSFMTVNGLLHHWKDWKSVSSNKTRPLQSNSCVTTLLRGLPSVLFSLQAANLIFLFYFFESDRWVAERGLKMKRHRREASKIFGLKVHYTPQLSGWLWMIL